MVPSGVPLLIVEGTFEVMLLVGPAGVQLYRDPIKRPSNTPNHHSHVSDERYFLYDFDRQADPRKQVFVCVETYHTFPLWWAI